MPIPEKLIDGANWMFDRYNSLLDSLPIPTKPEGGAFYHVITGISRTAIRNFALLREAVEADDQEHMAWTCRNLLELVIFLKCVLISKERLEEFASYRYIDGLQIIKRLRKLEEKYERDGHLPVNPNSQLAARAAEFERLMQAENIPEKGHLVMREWADTAGMLEEFDIMNKVCSKFVHPTVWSILTEDIGSARFPDAYEICFLYGTTYFSEMFNIVNEHIKQHGPKSKS